MRYQGFLGLFCAVAVVLAGAWPATTLADSSVTFQISPTHTGDQPDGLLIAPPARNWSVTYSGGRPDYAVIADGKVFVAAPTGNFFSPSQLIAYDEATGAVVWGPMSIGTGGFAFHTAFAAYDNGRVFIVSDTGFLCSFNGQTGAQYWFGCFHEGSIYQLAAPPVAVAGVIYLNGQSSQYGGAVFAIDELTGQVKWVGSTNVAQYSSPTVSPTGVYVDDGCQVYDLDPATGAPLWKWQDTTCSTGGSGVTTQLWNGRLYVDDEQFGAFGPHIFDASTGAILDTFPFGNYPALDGDTAYYGGDDMGIEAVDLSSGAVRWTFSSTARLANHIIANGVVYTGDANGTVYGLRASDGTTVFSTNVGAPVANADHTHWSSGLAAGDGYLAVPAGNSLLVFGAPHPIVAGVSPASGATEGGIAVNISGAGFAGTTAVSFGSTAAQAFTVNSDTSITAIVPTGEPGTIDVTVTGPTGTSPKSSTDQFTYVSPPVPVVTGLLPEGGSTAGGTTVVISGAGFTTATAVSFGGHAAQSFTVTSDTQITAFTPAEQVGTVDVTVTTLGGTSVVSNADSFTYVAPPTITSICPASGPIAGGTDVTIRGTNLLDVVSVEFGTVPAQKYKVLSGSHIEAVSPSEAKGTVDIFVTVQFGVSNEATAADQFTFASKQASSLC